MAYEKVVPIVLAGKRKEDPLSNHFSVENKAFIELENRTLIDWVFSSLQKAGVKEPCLLSVTETQKEVFLGKLKDYSYELVLNQPQESPVKSTIKALNLLKPDQSLLITTADNPLLSERILNFFLQKSLSSDADLVIGVVNGQDKLVQQLPHIKRTWHKVNNKTWLSGANLFYWSKKNFGNSLSDVLVRLETQRKNPFAFTSTVAKVNFVFLLKYLLQVSSIQECEQALSKAVGIKIKLLVLPFPEACIDVDKLEDYELVKKIVNKEIVFG